MCKLCARKKVREYPSSLSQQHPCDPFNRCGEERRRERGRGERRRERRREREKERERPSLDRKRKEGRFLLSPSRRASSFRPPPPSSSCLAAAASSSSLVPAPVSLVQSTISHIQVKRREKPSRILRKPILRARPSAQEPLQSVHRSIDRSPHLITIRRSPERASDRGRERTPAAALLSEFLHLEAASGMNIGRWHPA